MRSKHPVVRTDAHVYVYPAHGSVSKRFGPFRHESACYTARPGGRSRSLPAPRDAVQKNKSASCPFPDVPSPPSTLCHADSTPVCTPSDSQLLPHFPSPFASLARKQVGANMRLNAP